MDRSKVKDHGARGIDRPASTPSTSTATPSGMHLSGGSSTVPPHGMDRKRSHHQVIGRGDSMPSTQDIAQYLAGKRATENNVIYFHVPFCSKICTFCSLRRTLNQPANNYAELMRRELEDYASIPYIRESSFDSIYFGGGTPTTLSGPDLAMLLETVANRFRLTPDAEISLETSLTELDYEKARRIREAGANRVSVGVQTFSDRGRALFGRRGDGKFAVERLREIARAGLPNISIDIIYNYEGQTVGDVVRDVEIAAELGVSGFSMYSLMNMKSEHLKTGDAVQERRLFDALVNAALKQGFLIYENSKMVRHDCYKYIRNRLDGRDTVPVGAGAGGEICGFGIMNPFQIPMYEQSVANFPQRMGREMPPIMEKLKEIKGFMQRCFLPTTIVESYPRIASRVGELIADGHMTRLDQTDYYSPNSGIAAFENPYVLTPEGIYWGNNLSAELIQLVEESLETNRTAV